VIVKWISRFDVSRQIGIDYDRQNLFVHKHKIKLVINPDNPSNRSKGYILKDLLLFCREFGREPVSKNGWTYFPKKYKRIEGEISNARHKEKNRIRRSAR